MLRAAILKLVMPNGNQNISSHIRQSGPGLQLVNKDETQRLSDQTVPCQNDMPIANLVMPNGNQHISSHIRQSGPGLQVVNKDEPQSLSNQTVPGQYDIPITNLVMPNGIPIKLMMHKTQQGSQCKILQWICRIRLKLTAQLIRLARWHADFSKCLTA